MNKWGIVAVVVATPFIILLVLWLWVLSAPDPVSHPIAGRFPWPVACTTRGCITSTQWVEAYQVSVVFAQSTGEAPPTSAITLATLVRQHLVNHAVITSSVSAEDARRYREEILNQRDETAVKTATTLSLQDYDESVILPYLKQEALRQQRHIESLDELYAQLAKERWVLVLPISLRWDRTTGKIEPRAWYVPAES